MIEAHCRYCGEAISRAGDHACCEDCEYVVHKVPAHKRRYGRRAPPPPPVGVPDEPCPMMGVDEVIAAIEREWVAQRVVILTLIILFIGAMTTFAVIVSKQ